MRDWKVRYLGKDATLFTEQSLELVTSDNLNKTKAKNEVIFI